MTEQFQPGDRVLVNGNIVAEILSYSDDDNIVTFQHAPYGGGTDTVTSHLRTTAGPAVKIEHLAAALGSDKPASEDQATFTPLGDPAEGQDEVTTLEGQQ